MQDKEQSQASYSGGELIAAFIEKRLSDNLKAFKEHLPDIYDVFKNYQEERFYLIYDDHGNINLFDKKSEVTLYSNPVADTLNNLSEYEKKPVQRPYFIASADAKTKDEVNYIHSDIVKKLASEQFGVLKSIAANMIGNMAPMSQSNNQWFNSDSELPGFINALFCFSSGVGFDVEKLYLERDIKHFYLVEPDLDVFYASLQLVDWAAIIKKSIDKGFAINFIIDDSHDKLIESISVIVSKSGRHNVAGSYLYSSFYLAEYKSLFERLKSAISYSYLAGFGFYDDSRYSLAHTVGNISNGIPLLASNRKLSKNYGQSKLPVMIIGNGPSLDKSIDYIKEHQKNFVVVSCGSALRALIVNDVMPDFHVELERTASIPHWIKKSGQGIDGFFDKLKKITLIQVSQVHPDVAGLFGNAGMVLKDIETGSSFVHKAFSGKGAAILPRLAPTCVHSAITSMLVLGFKNLYLFGVDMGSIDPEKHHSRDSSYQYLKKERTEKFNFKKATEVYPSNFGDKEVFSTGLYPMFKRELESVVSGWKYTFQNTINVSNCSDGAKLEGIEAIEASSIPLVSEDECVNKSKIIRDVFDSHFSLTISAEEKQLESSLQEMKEAVSRACKYAEDLITPISNVTDAFYVVDKFTTDFHSAHVLEDSFAWVYSIFDGSLLYLLSIINSTAMLPATEAEKVEVVNKQFDLLKQFFRMVDKDFSENCLEWDKESRYSLFE